MSDIGVEITHLGYRERNGVTDFIVGFRPHGHITVKSRVEFYLRDVDAPDPVPYRVTNLWAPTLQNTQGFLELSAMRSFNFPSKFEVCDAGRLCPSGAVDNLHGGAIFLVCCTVDGTPSGVSIAPSVTP